MESKVCHSVRHGRHWTPLGVAVEAMPNQFFLNSVLLGCEQEADKVGLSKHVIGCRCGVVGLLSNEELDVLLPEGVMGVVGTVLAVFAWPEEE